MIDIVIPVYNAYEDLLLCVESLKKHTNLHNNRLILINDKSSDSKIKPYLKSLVSDTIIILNNSENLGFSETVNKGIKYSTNDVLLLNTDTIVTKNWVEKIIKCAYSDLAIGTVTPFSNNGTIVSVPNFNEDNIVPNGLTIDKYAEIIEHCSFRKYPRIPVAVGFCMFIKRELINKVGLFDSKTFGKGYGEENDFCFRAEQLGYYHALCDDTYIFHRGSASFLSNEKKKLIKLHEKILAKRYEQQNGQCYGHLVMNPNKYLQDNIAMNAKLQNESKNILLFLQADFRSDASHNIGGTQYHVRDLVMGLRNNFNMFVAARDGEYLRITSYIKAQVVSFKFYIGAVSAYPVMFEKSLKEIINSILIGFSIDLVHIHHVKGLSLDIFYEAHNLGIPIITTLHDFYFVCPCITLLDNKNELCIGNESKLRCIECLNKNLSFSTESYVLPNWREENLKALSLCDMLITPSKSAKNIILSYFPSLENSIKVIPHGSDTIKDSAMYSTLDYTSGYTIRYNIDVPRNDKTNQQLFSGWAYIEDLDSADSSIYIQITDKNGICEQYSARVISRLDVVNAFGGKYSYSGFSVYIPQDIFADGCLKINVIIKNHEIITVIDNPYIIDNHKFNRQDGFKVAFIGGLNISKGSSLACEIIKKSDKSINWYIFGGIGDANLFCLEKNNLQKTSWYVRDELPKILLQNKIDLICILPIWPETFCYTMSEALLAGIPVLLTDIGALEERNRELDCGWLISSKSTPTQILNKITEIKNSKHEYDEKKHNVLNLKIRNTFEMCEEYSEVYRNHFRELKKDKIYNTELIYDGYVLGTSFSEVKPIDSNNITLHNRILELERYLSSLTSSVTYKIVSRISRIKIPFRNKIKGLLLFFYKMVNKMK